MKALDLCNNISFRMKNLKLNSFNMFTIRCKKQFVNMFSSSSYTMPDKNLLMHRYQQPCINSRTFTISASNNMPLRNNKIPFDTMRVVYTDPITNEKVWKIVSKSEALRMAQSFQLDLILVSDKSDPVVCKIESYQDIVSKSKEKIIEQKKSQPKSLKEMHFGAAIADNDFQYKIAKVKEFLAQGYPVKTIVMIKKGNKKIPPEAVDATVLKVLEALENYVQSAQQLDSHILTRRDIVFSPKKVNN